MKNTVTLRNNKTSLDSFLPEVFPLEAVTELPKILEENVGNFCPICGKTIFSNLLEINGKVYLEKNCCKRELVFMENDVDFFLRYRNNTKVTLVIPDAKNFEEAMYKKPNYCLSAIYYYVTTRCNQKCPICYLRHDNLLNNGIDDLTLEKIRKELKKYKNKEIYLMGGEPTLREDLCELIKAVKESKNIPGIITNGQKLENKSYLEELKNSGLKIIILHFDAFNEVFNMGEGANKKITMEDYFERKRKILKGIEGVGGFRVHLGSPIGKESNKGEMNRLIQFSLENSSIDRINLMALILKEREHKMAPSRSDLIKIMERENCLRGFDREYFLELVKMYRNIYQTAIRLSSKTPLEKWVREKLSVYFEAICLEKKEGSLRLLFQKNEVTKINHILEDALKNEGRVGVFSALVKNSGKLINSPLLTLFKEKFLLSKKTSHSDKLFEISLSYRKDPKVRLLDNARMVVVLGSVGFQQDFIGY